MARLGKRRIGRSSAEGAVMGPEMRAWLRMRVRAARTRVHCLPEQWICGRCGTGLVRHPQRVDLYQHFCHRERADALLQRVQAELRGDM